MRRKILDELLQWKNDGNRKPLIIEGARQVGKTWIMEKGLGATYHNIAKLNFEKDDFLKKIFDNDYDTNRIIFEIETYLNIKISKHDTLIIFDEIQEAPRAITALKYFNEDNNDYHIVCAGSLLGVKLGQSSYPVGKINTLKMYPMDFEEFLCAIDEDNYVSLLHDLKISTINNFNDKYIELIRLYYLVGGMPEVVNSFSKERDINKVNKIQDEIINNYLNDMSKHAPNNLSLRIQELYESIPVQLAKENKSFKYSEINESSNSKKYKDPLTWLEKAGLVSKLYNVNDIGVPLVMQRKQNVFKVYLNDIGLLCRINKVTFESLNNNENLLSNFNGSLAEQYVYQQLLCNRNLDIFYWTTTKNTAEVDFVIDYKNVVVPIEVKSGLNTKAKSLKSYIDKYEPKCSIKSTLINFNLDSKIISIPLYGIGCIQKILENVISNKVI